MNTRKGSRYLQDHQIDYLKEHGENLTTLQLAKAIVCSQATIYWWCKKLYITPTKSFFQFRPPVIPVCEPYNEPA
jgi:hypothetical protein